MLKKVYVKMIEAKYYPKEEFKEKLDLLMSFGRITVDDYTELMLLLDKVYPVEQTQANVTPAQPTTPAGTVTEQGQTVQQ